MTSLLPMELMDKIVLMTRDYNVADALRSYVSQYVFDQIEKRVLIYGQVQGGKTKEIIKFIKARSHESPIVLVVQNSLLVLQQYEQKLKDSDVKYQIVDNSTIKQTAQVILVMNNKYRYNYFKKIEPRRFILMLDESDQTIRSCPLQAYKTVHITATPSRATQTFDRIIKVDVSPNYRGLDDLNIVINDSTFSGVESFLQTKMGIMLINKYSYEYEMEPCALALSRMYPNVPVVSLMSIKKMYLENKITIIRKVPIAKIIDNLSDYPHIIFIANRLSNRGLSYVSSDYKRHITFQITKVKSQAANFLQSLRILGIYNNNPQLTLIMQDKDQYMFGKHQKYIENFDVNSLRSV